MYAIDPSQDTGEQVADVIDLRDPVVADGLASLLSQFVGLTERATKAEAEVEVSRAERHVLAGKLRLVTDDLEMERAERSRLEIDNATLLGEERAREGHVQEIRTQLAWTRHQLAETEANKQAQLEQMQGAVEDRDRALSLMDGLLGSRKREIYRRLLAGREISAGTLILGPLWKHRD